MTVLNTAVADQLNAFKAAVDARVSNGEGAMQAIYDELRKYVEECKAIHFDGNGYTDEWKAEAASRGLDCEVSAPLMFDKYMSADSIAMFERTHVLNKKELEARTEVMWETYTKKIQIEARVLGDMAMNHILPVASSYESTLLDKIFKLKALFSDEQWKKVSARDIALVEQISAYIAEIQKLTVKLVDARKVANKIDCERTKAIAYHDTVASLFEEIRYYIDKLEQVVDNEKWPLPKYRELLFVR